MKPEWWPEAACRAVGPDVMHPTCIGARRPHPVRVAAAKAVCAGCPVRAECLTYAIEAGEPDGIWGGLTYDEREVERKARGIKRQRRRQPIAHGTTAGYRRHYRDGEAPCDGCKVAWNEDRQRRRMAAS